MNNKLVTNDGLIALNVINTVLDRKFGVKRKGWILNLLPNKRYRMTVWNNIYISDGDIIDADTIFHESQHYIDQCKYKDGIFYSTFLRSLWWYIKYFSPQIFVFFSLFSLLAINHSNLFLLNMLWTIFILPIPYFNYWRRHYETRGYFWTWALNPMNNRIRFSNIFNGWNYYKMDIKRSENYYRQLFNHMLSEIKIKKNDNMYNLYLKYEEFVYEKYHRIH